MFFILLLFFSIMTCCALFPIRNKRMSYFVYYFLGICLILIAGFRPEGIDRDYGNYIEHFINYFEVILLEPTFKVLAWSINTVIGPFPIYLFLIYAILGVGLKLVAITKLTDLYFLVLLAYLSEFFILHEMTQIRAGVASSFLLFAIKPLYERNFRLFFIYSLLATLFHYSAIILFPLWILNHKPQRVLQVWAVPVALGVYILNINIITTLPIPFIKEKMIVYQHLKETGDTMHNNINVFNSVYIVKVLVYYVMIWKYDILQNRNKYFVLLLKIYGLSLFLLPLLAAIPVFAFRLSELYGIVGIILIPMLCYIYSPRILSRCLVVLFCLVMLLISVLYNQLIISPL